MKTALLVIDVQNIYTDEHSEMYCNQADKTLANINRLIEQFEHAGSPLILVRHIHKPDGSDLGRMFDYAGPAEDFNFKDGSNEVEYSKALKRPANAIEVTKNRYSSFVGTGLDQSLKHLGVQRVVICGFMTNFCCESTARDAHDLDYFVDFIADATGTPGTQHMKQREIRDVVSALLAEGFAEVFLTKNYLKLAPSRINK
jgi:ureidoacrylate peracid hydrolase